MQNHCRFQLNSSNVVLKASEKHVFKLTDEAKRALTINAEYSSRISIDETFFVKLNAAHLYCNIISEQIVGSKKNNSWDSTISDSTSDFFSTSQC